MCLTHTFCMGPLVQYKCGAIKISVLLSMLLYTVYNMAHVVKTTYSVILLVISLGSFTSNHSIS